MKKHSGTDYWARSLFRLSARAAILGGWAAFFVPKLDSGALPAQATKPHEPLEGKGCADFHKSEASSKSRCLTDKDQMCDVCHSIPAAGGI